MVTQDTNERQIELVDSVKAVNYRDISQEYVDKQGGLARLCSQEAEAWIQLMYDGFLGGKKIPELMRGLGKGVKEFKDASNTPVNEEKKDEKTV